MLITAANIRSVKVIALNVSDDRISPYIDEAELLYVIDRIGAELYEALINRTDESTILGINYNDLMNGCYYTDSNGVRQHSAGLINAISYLAFSRFVRYQNINITPFGVTLKTSLDSEKVEDKTIQSASMEAFNTGMQFLQESINFKNNGTSVVQTVTRTKFKAIGD